MKPLAACRADFAADIVARAGVAAPRLREAFATTPREDYLGPPPWQLFGGAALRSSETSDPRLLYQDVLVSLADDRGINNGQPSLHALSIAAAAPAPGETALHIGAGTGYYTAILAAMVGGGGAVIAYEIEADLAAQARRHLQPLPQVQVRHASGAEGPLPPADVVYVSAGASHPLQCWLDALKPGGRLVFPLTPEHGFGVMLRLTRCRDDAFAALALTRVSFIPCIGARDAAASAALSAALASKPIEAVRSLRRHVPPDATAWCVGDGWWLSTARSA